MTGVEITSMDRRVAMRSATEYWRVAVHAPSATPPIMPMNAPRKTRRTDTRILAPIMPLMLAPLGVMPQSQWRTTPLSQVT